MTTNNLSQKSVVFESPIKPSQVWHAWLDLTEDSRTADLGQIWMGKQ